jgi:hypothetical protein
VHVETDTNTDECSYLKERGEVETQGKVLCSLRKDFREILFAVRFQVRVHGACQSSAQT